MSRTCFFVSSEAGLFLETDLKLSYRIFRIVRVVEKNKACAVNNPLVDVPGDVLYAYFFFSSIVGRFAD